MSKLIVILLTILLTTVIGVTIMLSTLEAVSNYDSPFYTNVEQTVKLEVRQAVLDIGFDPDSYAGMLYAKDMRTAYMEWYGRLLAEKVFYHRHPDETVPGTLTEQNYKPKK